MIHKKMYATYHLASPRRLNPGNLNQCFRPPFIPDILSAYNFWSNIYKCLDLAAVIILYWKWAWSFPNIRKQSTFSTSLTESWTASQRWNTSYCKGHCTTQIKGYCFGFIWNRLEMVRQCPSENKKYVIFATRLTLIWRKFMWPHINQCRKL